MIISGGENVHPLEVEDVLAAHPAVREVAVIGVADERLGQHVTAVVVGHGVGGRARRPLPRLAARALQAAARVPLRRLASEERVGEDPPQDAAGRDRRRRVSGYDGFRVERDPGRAVATITLDVPGKLNRVSMAARDQLSAVFAELDADDGVRFVVLTGAGGQFTAGGDIAGFLERSPWQVSQLARNVAAPERCSKPVIARLEGYVFGVGLELALACDFRLAADDVQLGLPEVTIGMIPGSGGTQRLARMVGLGRAKDIVMRGRRIKADEALALGLVARVVPADELDAAVGSLVEELSRTRRSRSPWRSASSTPRTTARSTSGSSSRGSRTASSGRRTTSARAWRRSARSAGRSSPATDDRRGARDLDRSRQHVSLHMRKTPNVVSGTGAFAAAARPSASTRRRVARVDDPVVPEARGRVVRRALVLVLRADLVGVGVADRRQHRRRLVAAHHARSARSATSRAGAARTRGRTSRSCPRRTSLP